MFSSSLLVIPLAVSLAVPVTGQQQEKTTKPPLSACRKLDDPGGQPTNETFYYHGFFQQCIDIPIEADTWERQLVKCWNRQGDLGVPQTPMQNRAFYNLAFMLYGEQDPPMTQLWIGARWSDAYQAIVTTKNETLNLSDNWEIPDDGGNGQGKCVALNIWAEDIANEERWSKVDCDKKLPAICFELKGNSTHEPMTMSSTVPTTSPTTTFTCPNASCYCDGIPLCGKSARCPPDACLIENKCYSVVRGPFNFYYAYKACASRKPRTLFIPNSWTAKYLFRFAATVGDTCNTTKLRSNPDIYNAVWVAIIYRENNTTPIIYEPTYNHTLEKWYYAAYFTNPACWRLNASRMILKTAPEEFAMYAACMEDALNTTTAISSTISTG